MRITLVAAICAALTFGMQQASAAITWTFGTEFSGSGSSLSGPVIVTLDDGGGTGNVTVTIDATGLDGTLTEYVSGLYLNLNPDLPLMSLSMITDGGSVDPISAPKAYNAHKADGDGFFDIRVNWGNQSFTAGETDTLTFSLAGLTEGDFDFLSAPGPGGTSGPFVAALRARSLGDDGEGSGWFYPETVPVTVHEPGTLTLFGAGLIGLGAVRRRRSTCRQTTSDTAA